MAESSAISYAPSVAGEPNIGLLGSVPSVLFNCGHRAKETYWSCSGVTWGKAENALLPGGDLWWRPSTHKIQGSYLGAAGPMEAGKHRIGLLFDIVGTFGELPDKATGLGRSHLLH